MSTLSTPSRSERVAFLGPLGTFSHQAAVRHFGDGIALVESPSIPGVFDAVTREQADWGIVPLENSIEGGVSFTLDTLLETSLLLCGEAIEPIEQCLLSNAADQQQIERVYSIPPVFAQCRRWLMQNLPGATQLSSPSTAQAAHEVKDDPRAAAIASRVAGELAGVRLVARGIQDRKQNATRFVVLGTREPEPTGHDKTSLVFTTKDERGALVRALSIFDQESINLSRIESRPRSGEEAWQYVFFTDLEGHRKDPSVQRALTKLATVSDMVKVFGSYPKAPR
jgi:chorismate mutase / prephenate dehydratase